MDRKDLTPTRLEAFSDGVIAIIITIMVLELKVPHDTGLAGLAAQWPVFASYALSFLMVAIYWINHHHLFRYVHKVSNGILWANMLLLFCLSLIPFFTAYMGENHMAAFPAALYLGALFVCGAAFMLLLATILRHQKADAEVACFARAAIIKNLAALVLYAAGTGLAGIHTGAALALAVVVALMYVLPNAWLEKR